MRVDTPLLINTPSRGEKWVGSLPASHPFSMAFVLLNHPFGLLGLMFVMRGLGLVILFLGLFFHSLHLPFGLALRPRRACGCTRTQQQEQRQKAGKQMQFLLHGLKILGQM